MNLEQLMIKMPTLSLKRICDETKICYQYALKLSKLPEVGKVYKVDSFNFKEVQKMLDNKKVDLSKIDWDTIVKNIKVYEPVNEINDFKVNDEFKLRNDESTFKVIFKTASYIVFIANGSEQPRVMNNDTFLHQSPRLTK